MHRTIIALFISFICFAFSQTSQGESNPESIVLDYFATWNANDFEGLRSYIHPGFAEQTKEGVIIGFKNGQIEGLPKFSPELLPVIPAYDVLMEVELSFFDELGIIPFEVEILGHHFLNNDKVFVDVKVSYDEYSTIILLPLKLSEGKWLIYASANILAMQGISMEMLVD